MNETINKQKFKQIEHRASIIPPLLCINTNYKFVKVICKQRLQDGTCRRFESATFELNHELTRQEMIDKLPYMGNDTSMCDIRVTSNFLYYEKRNS